MDLKKCYFHTIKSILNYMRGISQPSVAIYFHTIKSILNLIEEVMDLQLVIFPYY